MLKLCALEMLSSVALDSIAPLTVDTVTSDGNDTPAVSTKPAITKRPCTTRAPTMSDCAMLSDVVHDVSSAPEGSKRRTSPTCPSITNPSPIT